MPAPKGRNCVQINEKKMNVSVYSILTNWTQKVPETGAGQLWICVQKVNNQGKVKVYSILTKWTQKDQDRRASADGNCVQFALLGCCNEYFVLYESGHRSSLGMDNYR